MGSDLMVMTLFLEIFASYFGISLIFINAFTEQLYVSVALPLLTCGCMQVNDRPL
jgi:hypothetical protein